MTGRRPADRCPLSGVRRPLYTASVRPRAILLLLATALAACSRSSVPCDDTTCPAATTIRMDFTGAAGFYASPFPGDTRVGDDGRPRLDDFPNPRKLALIETVRRMLTASPRGFGLTSGIFFAASAPIDPASLPDVHASVGRDASVFLVGVDPGAPDRGRRYPISTRFLPDGGPFGAPNLLVALPYQGFPLRPRTRYAVAVRTAVRAASGDPLAIGPSMAQLAAGRRPPGMSETAHESYKAALVALGEAGVDAKGLAALTVFTTGSPEDDLTKVTTAMRAKVPSIRRPFAPAEVFPTFCVYQTRIPMPEYQGGVPPYTGGGGAWVLDAKGAPLVQREEESNFVVTVPRTVMPAAGYPIVVFSRTGGGGERPLVDRGVEAASGGPPLAPGTGPAFTFAKAGWAGSSIDGPHGGLRNVTRADEQFLMFDVANPPALRDNVRQSAAELALQAHILEKVTVDVSLCPGATAPGQTARFDPGMMALMGHSMGATIAPLTAAVEPRFRALLLSGAGGSWIANVMHKQKPLAVKPLAELLLGITGSGYPLTAHDPALSLYQWVGEEADPPVYGRRILAEPVGQPRHVLMMQGIADTYIPPPVANATSLSFGLDLAGPALDVKSPAFAGLTGIEALLGLAARKRVALPVERNVQTASAPVTAVVTQHLEDGIEDGHEVVFQTEGPKHAYRCFLEGLARGAPRVPSAGRAADPCD